VAEETHKSLEERLKETESLEERLNLLERYGIDHKECRKRWLKWHFERRKEAEEADYRSAQRLAEQDKKDREKRLEEEALCMAKERLADKKSGRQTMEGEFDFKRLSPIEQRFLDELGDWVRKRKIRLKKERLRREELAWGRANPLPWPEDEEEEPEEPEGSWADLWRESYEYEEDEMPEDSWGDLIYEASQYR
jgi:hypothetical protein